ncbi:hypothetical protein ACC771_23000, partial [Rhizobium ruizarguesonis]
WINQIDNAVAFVPTCSDLVTLIGRKAAMVQLTAYETRGGGRSLNSYDAAINGNFDDDEPVLDTRH